MEEKVTSTNIYQKNTNAQLANVQSLFSTLMISMLYKYQLFYEKNMR